METKSQTPVELYLSICDQTCIEYFHQLQSLLTFTIGI
jgi:hypothetical protein